MPENSNGRSKQQLSLGSLSNRIQRINQQINRLQQRAYRIKQHRQLDHLSYRRARTRSLIQLGGLIEKSGLLDELGIMLDVDLQKDAEMQEPIAILMGALIDIIQALQQGDLSRTLLRERGMQALANKK